MSCRFSSCRFRAEFIFFELYAFIILTSTLVHVLFLIIPLVMIPDFELENYFREK